MSELPSGWCNAKFTEVFDVQGGTQPPKSTFIDMPKNGYIRLLQIRDFGSKPVPTYIPEKETLKRCEKDDLLIARYGASLGRICTGMEGAYNVALAKFICPEQINKSFAKYYLRSDQFQSPLRLLSRSAQNGFNKEDLADFDFSFPPFAEQTRIAQKLDELLAQVDTLKARIDAIPALLKRFRQSVLAAAIDGTLTENWRQGSGIAFEWSTVVFSDLLREFRGGASQKPSDLMEGVPVIRSSAVRSMTVDFSDIRYFDSETELNDRDFALEGDLLFTRLSGSPEFVGVCARVRTTPKKPTQFPDRLFCARLKDKNHGPYLEIFFASRAYLGYIRDNLKSSAGHQRITTEIVKSALILLPSIAEQTEIVRRVEQLFAFADQLEAKVASAKSRIDHLTQSILAKAFRGELVPQDPNDEPASVLLERIKAQRAAAPKAKRGRKMTV